MFSPTPLYRKTAGLRLRPVPEMAMCIAFTPAEPELFTLNQNAWLILELADGRDPAQLEAAYLRYTVPPQTALLAQRSLKEGVEMLLRQGILALRPSGHEEPSP